MCVGASPAEPSFDKGDLVEIPKLGEAEVTSVNDDKVEVILPDGSRKTIKSDFLSVAEPSS